MLAEYAATYGSVPEPHTPWPIVLALAKRMKRFDARALLMSILGTSLGARQAFTGGKEIQPLIRELRQDAFPGQTPKPVTFARKQSKDDDG